MAVFFETSRRELWPWMAIEVPYSLPRFQAPLHLVILHPLSLSVTCLPWTYITV